MIGEGIVVRDIVITKEILVRFWSRIHITEGCWEWTRGTNSEGYGDFTLKDKMRIYTHRFMYILYNGPIPSGLKVLHTCDNPPCARPNHLFLGTSLDNTTDMMMKGRHVRTSGEMDGMAKLTDAEVLAIRAEYVRGKVGYIRLGYKYGVGPSAIQKIINRQRWAHI